MRQILTLILILVCSASSFALQEMTDDVVKIKMLHVFIKADVNDVRFENLWVYRRDNADRSWGVNIEIPENAYLQGEEDIHNEQNSRIVSKDFTPDSQIGSVSFTYFINNIKGKCRVSFKPDYEIESMVVYVSGPQTIVRSDSLKFDGYRTLRSRYSGVYTAENINAGQTVNIELSALPADENMLIQYISVFSLALIVLTALLTLIACKFKLKNCKSNKHEACFEQHNT